MSSPSITCRLTDLADAYPEHDWLSSSAPGQLGALREPGRCELQGILRSVEAHIRANDYKGWDPFDGLNSRLFTALGLQRSALLRLACIQFFKRSPINFRQLALVPKTVNPKALALMSMGYGRSGDTNSQAELIHRLLATRLDAGGWGYPFDWQARAFYVPAGTPNVICTAYAVQALIAHQRDTATDHGGVLAGAAHFVATELIREAKGLTYIAYVPTTDVLVHNANLWGAYVLAAADQAVPHCRYEPLIRATMHCSIRAQNDDGSWPYGSRPHHQFVDSFHTGFNLQALELLEERVPDADLGTVIDRGLRYYARTFFDEDGRPWYYAGTPWPIDCHSAAQACLTLLGRRATVEYRRLACNVLSWTVRNMWDQKRHIFHYQRHRRYANTIDYLRWTQAWMFLAIAHTLQVLSTQENRVEPIDKVRGFIGLTNTPSVD